MSHALRAVVLAALITLASACGAAPTAQSPLATSLPTSAPAPQPTALTAPTAPESVAPTFTDALGNSVTLKAAPQRIVSIAPSATEILFAVGAGGQVVGDTQFCNYPPEADKLPKIGGFSAETISIEKIVDLAPDLVIAGSASQRAVAEALAQAKIPTLLLDPRTFEEVYANIAQVGAVSGHGAQATQVVEQMRQRVDAVKATIATVPADKRPTLFWEVYDEPLMSAGPHTFIGQMIELAGAKSIFADATEDYPQVSAEVIVARNPQVILGPDAHGGKLTAEQLAARPGWAQIDAVQNKRVYVLDGDTTSRPGPRLVEALEDLARTLYPALYR